MQKPRSILLAVLTVLLSALFVSTAPAYPQARLPPSSPPPPTGSTAASQEAAKLHGSVSQIDPETSTPRSPHQWTDEYGLDREEQSSAMQASIAAGVKAQESRGRRWNH